MEPTITSIQPLPDDGLLVDFSRNISCVIYSLLILALVMERKLNEIIVSLPGLETRQNKEFFNIVMITLTHSVR
jgi:hypothetical protein